MFQASSVGFETISKSCGSKPSHLAVQIPRVLLESFITLYNIYIYTYVTYIMKCIEMLESVIIQYGNPY